MCYPPSGESLEPKLPLKNLFNCRLRLIEVLCNNSCSRKRKLFKEIGASLLQNVRRMTMPEFVFAWKIARLEASTLFFDLSQWVNCRAEYGGQSSANCLGSRAFEEEEFDDEFLLRFFHLAKWRRANVMSTTIIFFTVLCRILLKIIEVRNN
jgi:hypothetical protein